MIPNYADQGQSKTVYIYLIVWINIQEFKDFIYCKVFSKEYLGMFVSKFTPILNNDKQNNYKSTDVSYTHIIIHYNNMSF